jgi:hypothetical protein
MNSLHDVKVGIDASYKKNDEAKQILANQGFSLDNQLSGQRANFFLIQKASQLLHFVEQKINMIW